MTPFVTIDIDGNIRQYQLFFEVIEFRQLMYVVKKMDV
jgi:hypothetical protein